MIIKGSHNSITGHKSKDLLSKLIIPFARCQSKTIMQQLNNGVRYFDIRIKHTKNGYVLGHGLWTANVSIDTIFNILNAYGRNHDIYVDITLENNKDRTDFLKYVKKLISSYINIQYGCISAKKPNWIILDFYNPVKSVNRFKELDGSTWHTLIPIPWIWNKIYHYKDINGVVNIRDFV